MVNEGYIKLYRKMVKWGWYKETNTKAVFLHLLFMAQYEPCYYKGEYLEEGQIATSFREISHETGISERSVRTAIEHLEATGELTHKSSRKFSIFTIQNYSEYQGTTQQPTQDRKRKGRKERKEAKERKEVKEKEQRISLSRARAESEEREKPSFDGLLKMLERRMKNDDGVI